MESSVKEIQNVQLNILKELAEVCEKNGLRYYLAFGTCLGAVRHKGFIPWDDDIDVLMPVEDVDKLLKMQNEFSENYFIQSRHTDKNYQSIAVRIRDNNTTCIEKEEEGLDINHGIYIDIYPYFSSPNSKIGLLFNIWRSYIYRTLVAGREPYNHGRILKIGSKILLTLYQGEKRERKIQKMEYKLRNVTNGKEILDYFGQDITLFSAITYDQKWFDIPKKIEFEGYYFNAPTEPEKYLAKRYGDFMKLPPLEEQKKHHSYVMVDVNKSYKELMGK